MYDQLRCLHIRFLFIHIVLLYICMVIFWNRIMKMDDSTLVKHIFNYDYGICQNNWSADMKYIFSMLDINDVFNNVLMCNMKIVREQMTILNNRQWSIDVNNKSKLRTYILFKSDLLLEDYVKISHAQTAPIFICAISVRHSTFIY